MIKGLPKRLEKETNNMKLYQKGAKILNPPSAKHEAWIGASILASLDSFKYLTVKHEEYNEQGPAAVIRKCF